MPAPPSSEAPAPSPSALGERLRAHGLRVTTQRRAILGTLIGSPSRHLSAGEVYELAREQLPELSRATVYNTLAEFRRVHLLQTVEGLGAVRYDAALGEDHAHFHCLGCGRIFDLPARRHEHLASPEPGFVLHRAQVLLEGTCPSCSTGREGA